MIKKYTRKQLKQPDEFITFSMKAWEALHTHVPFVLVSLLVAALIIGGVWTWSHFANNRAIAATAVLNRGLELNSQPLLPNEDKDKLAKPEKDDIPRYKTNAEKWKAVGEEFTKGVKQGGALGQLALVMRASVNFDAGNYKEAIKDYKAYLADSSEQLGRDLVIEGLGYCFEALKEWDKALEQFRLLPQDGEKRHLTSYHEARLLAKQGKKEAAAKLFKQVIEKSASQTLQDNASDQLAILESK